MKQCSKRSALLSRAGPSCGTECSSRVFCTTVLPGTRQDKFKSFLVTVYAAGDGTKRRFQVRKRIKGQNIL